MLQELWNRILELSGAYLPNLLGALAILILGWIAALILAAVVRGALRRTTLDDRLAGWLRGETDEPVEVERGVGQVVFWLTMLLVLVGFFEVLELTIVTEPLRELLSEIAGYVPRILAGGGLLLFAWVVAVVLRKVVAVALERLDIDRRLAPEEKVDDEEAPAEPVSFGKTLSEAVYWFVFLLFLPAVLAALEVQGLLGPVETLVDEVLGFLPNLLAAGLILAIGWVVARLVQRICANLLAAAGFDRLGARVGLGERVGTRSLSGLTGLVVYILILVPVVVAALEALQVDAVTEPASEMLSQMVQVLPDLFAASLLLVITWFVARLVAELAVNLLSGAGFDNVLAHLGLGELGGEEGRTPSSVVGTLIIVGLMLFASVEAASLMGLDNLAMMLSDIVYFLGDVVLAVIVLGIGLYLGRVAADAIRASATAQAGLLAASARIAIVALSGAMALRQLGLAEDIINLAFGLLLGAVAVAAALAFGLGSRELAGRKMESWTRSLEPGGSAPDERRAGPEQPA